MNNRKFENLLCLVMQMFEEIKAAGLKQLMFMFQGQG
jgi:hypothetical protein